VARVAADDSSWWPAPHRNVSATHETDAEGRTGETGDGGEMNWAWWRRGGSGGGSAGVGGSAAAGVGGAAALVCVEEMGVGEMRGEGALRVGE
jgi:hypothetical protein